MTDEHTMVVTPKQYDDMKARGMFLGTTKNVRVHVGDMPDGLPHVISADEYEAGERDRVADLNTERLRSMADAEITSLHHTAMRAITLVDAVEQLGAHYRPSEWQAEHIHEVAAKLRELAKEIEG